MRLLLLFLLLSSIFCEENPQQILQRHLKALIQAANNPSPILFGRLSPRGASTDELIRFYRGRQAHAQSAHYVWAGRIEGVVKLLSAQGTLEWYRIAIEKYQLSPSGWVLVQKNLFNPRG
ncbi:unnamed protein product [Caenorhabditis sp. 36 PRJEB53466]|nr:unnamed protein product [Caenorhabditis sp. 36 PRJEB53466]